MEERLGAHLSFMFLSVEKDLYKEGRSGEVLSKTQVEPYEAMPVCILVLLVSFQEFSFVLH